jgi:hypothetical protein
MKSDISRVYLSVSLVAAFADMAIQMGGRAGGFLEQDLSNKSYYSFFSL